MTPPELQRLAPLDRIGEQHEVVRFIAEGATSAVYEARDLTSGEHVAIKLLHDQGWEADDDPVGRFACELELASRLDSPYLPRVLGSGWQREGRPFMVMELLEGVTLKERLAQVGRLPIDITLAIARELFLAIEAVHAAAVVHRDVKPRNIVLHETPDGPHIKLVDFGISTPLGSVFDGGSDSQYAMGTPAYMSPEQLAGVATDQAVDIYSAGVVLYEMITGRRPFDAPDLDLLTRSILFDPTLPPSVLRPSCPLALEELVLRCLERNALNRPRTARTVAEGLHGIAVALGMQSPRRRIRAALHSVPQPNREAASGETVRVTATRASSRVRTKHPRTPAAYVRSAG